MVRDNQIMSSWGGGSYGFILGVGICHVSDSQ